MSKKIIEEFEVFRGQCVWLLRCYNTFQALYDSDNETSDLLINTAELFFSDLNIVFQEYCLLQISKVTDKASTGGRDNLTIMYIDSLLEDNNIMTDEISICSCHLNRFGKKLKLVRNKLLAHHDKKTMLTNKTLPTFASKKDAEMFFDYLRKYIEEVGRVVGAGPLKYSAFDGAANVSIFIEKLRAR